MRKALAILAALVLAAAAPPAAAQPEAAHREAIQHYLEASRTLVLLRHFGMPIDIRMASVNWGFDPLRLNVDDILAMESHLETEPYQRELFEVHARLISTEDALEAARFYESERGRRYLGWAGSQGMLPSTDPLLRDGAPALQPGDKEAMAAFIASPTGQRLKAVEKQATAELLAVQRRFAERAVERYAAERGIAKRPPAAR